MITDRSNTSNEFQIRSDETSNVAAIGGSIAAFIIVVLIIVALSNDACVEGEMPEKLGLLPITHIIYK
ncbi:hypothetical protein AM593_07725, partial [Mytilus galloprovincialis]